MTASKGKFLWIKVNKTCCAEQHVIELYAQNYKRSDTSCRGADSTGCNDLEILQLEVNETRSTR